MGMEDRLGRNEISEIRIRLVQNIASEIMFISLCSGELTLIRREAAEVL